MNILVPYVRLRPELPARLDEFGITAQFVDTSGPVGYWETLRDWWGRGERFIVLEQDKIPGPGILAELWYCVHSWCTTPVSMRGVQETSPYPSLSCTKFGRPLMRKYPNLLEEVGLLNLGLGLKEWSRLDMGIAGILGHNHECHWHRGGRVEHLHDL